MTLKIEKFEFQHEIQILKSYLCLLYQGWRKRMGLLLPATLIPAHSDFETLHHPCVSTIEPEDLTILLTKTNH